MTGLWGRLRNWIIEDGSRWRHCKRGTTYQVVGECRMESATPVVQGELLVVYRADHDGTLWVRPHHEFHDGRFELVPTQVGFHPEVMHP